MAAARARPPRPALALMLALALCWTAPARAADMAVIVNLKSTVVHLAAEQAAQIFLGRSDQMTPIDLADNSPIRSEFYRRLAGKDQDQVKAIWSKIVFTGKGFPPKEYNTDAAVKRAVAADPVAIGYIDKAAVDDTVRVVLIVQ